MKKLVASDMSLATSWQGSLKSIFPIYGNTSKGSPLPAFWPGGAFAPYKVLACGQNLGAGAIHLPRALKSPKGGAARWAAEPKTKGNCKSSCLSFWYAWWDSNPHASLHENLNLACLPIPSQAHRGAGNGRLLPLPPERDGRGERAPGHGRPSRANMFRL